MAKSGGGAIGILAAATLAGTLLAGCSQAAGRPLQVQAELAAQRPGGSCAAARLTLRLTNRSGATVRIGAPLLHLGANVYGPVAGEVPCGVPARGVPLPLVIQAKGPQGPVRTARATLAPVATATAVLVVEAGGAAPAFAAVPPQGTVRLSVRFALPKGLCGEAGWAGGNGLGRVPVTFRCGK